MKNLKNKVVVKTNRGYTLIMTTRYAKKTPEWFWESVYEALKHIAVFDGVVSK